MVPPGDPSVKLRAGAGDASLGPRVVPVERGAPAGRRRRRRAGPLESLCYARAMRGSADLYKILQVDPEAEDDVIQAAYRRLARKYHPDVAPGPEAERRMSAINEAWRVLHDPTSRAAYDTDRALESESRPGAAGSQRAAWAAGAPTAGSAGTPPADEEARRSPQTQSPGGTDARPAGADSPTGAPPGRRPDEVSPDWSTGRSRHGGGYDPQTMRAPDGPGAAGPPPGNPSGSVLNFGRYAGWSLGEIARYDADFLEDLDRRPIGRRYAEEIDALLRRVGRRRTAGQGATDRRGLFRRR